VAYYLGVDGGGTKTTCVLGNEYAVLAAVTTGPSNITRVGEQVARDSLHRAIDQACAAAGITPAQLTNSCIGAAGAAREENASIFRSMLAEKLPTPFRIVGDMEIALQAAFGAGPGVIVIAGTGSIAHGRDAQGRTTRAGGWGFAISDEGSAHWIGRQALVSLIRSADQILIAVEQKNTDPLFHELNTAWNVSSLPQLANAANSNPDFSALLPAVLAAADAGDELAKRILTQAAAELARIASIVLRRLFPPEKSAGGKVSLAMAGGVFRYSAAIRKEFGALVRASYAEVAINCEVVDPVQGALALARQLRS